MMKRKVFNIFFAALVAFSPVAVSAADAPAGFGSIWYSKDPFVAGERIEIHTIVFNSGSAEFSGTVEFYDSDKLLGKTAVRVPAGGRFAQISVPWTATEGYHKIFAVIKDAQAGKTSVTLESGKSDESEKFVAAPAGAADASATSSAKQYIEDKLEVAKEYVEKNLPAPVSGSLDAASGALETARVAGKTFADAKGAEANEKIRLLNAAASKTGTSTASAVEKPLAYLVAFLADLASMAFGSVLAFYLAVFGALFFLIRFIRRVFFF